MPETVTLEFVNQDACSHQSQMTAGGVSPSTLDGCEDCLKLQAAGEDAYWVHLRICMTCGHVGCCNSSPNQHASKHWIHSHHPIIRSFEPGEEWGWCYADRTEP
jgi:hypothetical protein